MTISTQPRVRNALRSAAVRATLAPSVYRTEPWRLVLRDTSLEIHADWSRQLHALDPAGRQLVISCGSAVLNAHAALAAADQAATVERLPEPSEPDLLARLTLLGEEGGDPSLAHLVAGVGDTQATAPLTLSDEVLMPPSAASLQALAGTHDVDLEVVTDPEQLLLAGRLSRLSLLQQESDPASHAELRAWRTLSPGADGPRHGQVMVVLGTTHDTPLDWLRTGEALQHLVLKTRRAFGARPLPHLIDNPRIRAELRHALGQDSHPQVVLQLGPPLSLPPSRNRRLVDVLSVAH